jgi:hypothetical protein
MGASDLANAYARGLYHGLGIEDHEKKPLIGIANSATIHPS